MPADSLLFSPLLQALNDQLRPYLHDLCWQQSWDWPNPDAGHVRLRGRALHSGERRTLDLRVRHSADLVAGQARPVAAGPAVAHVGRWLFDGAEQVAMTDFWVLALDAGSRPPLCVVLPTPALLRLLRQARQPGQLLLYFTATGACYDCPPQPAKRADPHRNQEPDGWTSVANLSRYTNGWHQFVEEPHGHCF